MVGNCTKVLSGDPAQIEVISKMKVVNVLNQLRREKYSEQALISAQVFNLVATLSQGKKVSYSSPVSSFNNCTSVRRVAVISTSNKTRNMDIKQKQ